MPTQCTFDRDRPAALGPMRCRGRVAPAPGCRALPGSPTTAQRWAGRYRETGKAGTSDRFCRPCCSSGRRAPARTERRIVTVRVLPRWGPARIACLLGLNPSTVHRVCAATEPGSTAPPPVIRRYERVGPGELVHCDFQNPAVFPTAAGTKSQPAGGPQEPCQGRHELPAQRPWSTARSSPTRRRQLPSLSWNARTYFASCGITVQRVMTDDGACCTSYLWRNTLTNTPADAGRRRTRRSGHVTARVEVMCAGG